MVTVGDAGEFSGDGLTCYRAALDITLVAELSGLCPKVLAAGVRLYASAPLMMRAIPILLPILLRFRAGMQPVRAMLFDKSIARNWAVGWHQDRTIAVRQRLDTPDFGPWSKKDGVQHVEPPFPILAEMVSLRLHLDACPEDNAPLRVAAGSHRASVAADAAADIARSLPQVTCIADAGDVWLYATPIIHSSERARIPSRRRVLQVDFSASQLPCGLEWPF